jgi:hypothetical protein
MFHNQDEPKVLACLARVFLRDTRGRACMVSTSKGMDELTLPDRFAFHCRCQLSKPLFRGIYPLFSSSSRRALSDAISSSAAAS